MEAWYKARQYVVVLKHRQQKLQLDINKVKTRIEQLIDEINNLKIEYSTLNQKIDSLTPIGVLVRSELYRGIRQQGALISFQQTIIHKITMLEQKLEVEKNKMKDLSDKMVLINKKNYKISHFIENARKKRARYIDNNVESEVQEMVIYGKRYK